MLMDVAERYSHYKVRFSDGNGCDKIVYVYKEDVDAIMEGLTPGVMDDVPVCRMLVAANAAVSLAKEELYNMG